MTELDQCEAIRSGRHCGKWKACALFKVNGNYSAQGDHAILEFWLSIVRYPESSKETKYLDFNGRPPKFYTLVIIFKKGPSANQTNIDKTSVIRFNSDCQFVSSDITRFTHITNDKLNMCGELKRRDLMVRTVYAANVKNPT